MARGDGVEEGRLDAACPRKVYRTDDRDYPPRLHASFTVAVTTCLAAAKSPIEKTSGVKKCGTAATVPDQVLAELFPRGYYYMAWSKRWPRSCGP